jgi:hypothetical protein
VIPIPERQHFAAGQMAGSRTVSASLHKIWHTAQKHKRQAPFVCYFAVCHPIMSESTCFSIIYSKFAPVNPNSHIDYPAITDTK